MEEYNDWTVVDGKFRDWTNSQEANGFDWVADLLTNTDDALQQQQQQLGQPET